MQDCRPHWHSISPVTTRPKSARARPGPWGASQQPDAIRILSASLGDWNLYNPSVEVYTAYEPAFPLDGQDVLLARIRRAVRPLVSTGNAAVDFEAARLLAMLEDNDATLPAKLMLKFNERSTPGSDVHYLTVLSRLKVPLTTNHLATIAN